MRGNPVQSTNSFTSFINVINLIATHPGKWEMPGNFVLHVPGLEMSLKIKKICDLPWKSLLKA
jgi:hypothetical protein